MLLNFNMQIIYLISGILICRLITYTSKFTFPINQKYLKSFPPNFLMQIYFAICSLILMYTFGYELNFKISLNHIWKIMYQVFILFFISFIIVGAIIDFIKSKSLISESDKKESNFGTPPNQIIFMFMIMFVNPITEELFYRGFLLNHILLLDYNLIENSIFILSLPVFLSGLYFGVDHYLALSKMKMNKYFVYNITLTSIIVGSACGYFYIEYDSFSAAIIVHFMANFTGMIVGSLKEKLIN